MQPSQTVKAKEHTQNLSGKNSTSNPPTEAEKKAANNDALHTQNAASKTNDTNDNPKLADALQQLAPHIGATMLALSLLGSLIYTKLIAKPFQYMSDALKDIMNLDFSDKSYLTKIQIKQILICSSCFTSTKYCEEFTCKQSRFKK